MKLIIHLSGSTLFEADVPCVPQIGSALRFRTIGYKKGLNAGSHIIVRVTNDEPPDWEFASDGSVTVYLSANGYEVIEEGPDPPD